MVFMFAPVVMVVLWVVVRHPHVGLALSLALPQVGLVVISLGLPYSIVGVGAYAIAAVALVASLATSSEARDRVGLPIALLVLACVAVGVVGAWGILPTGQIVQGVRLFTAPIVCALIGFSVSPRQMSAILKALTLLLAASAMVAVYQSMVGVDALVRQGLEYGTNVRTFDGRLRAPGLSATNYELGSFAGVMVALAVTWWGRLDPRKTTTAWRAMAVAGGLVALWESSLRSGFTLLVVAVGIGTMVGSRDRIGSRAATLAGAAGLIFGVVASGLGSLDSLHERLVVWDRLFEHVGFSALGHGMGFAGAASNSRFASTRIVTDNYYVATVLQSGLLGALLAALLVVWVVGLLVRVRHAPLLMSAAVFMGFLVAMAVAEFWEYAAAAGLVWAALTCAVANSPSPSPVSVDRGSATRLPRTTATGGWLA